MTLRVKPNETPAEAAAAAASAAGVPAKASTGIRLNGCDAQHPGQCNVAERWLVRVVDKGATMTREQWAARMRALAPYGMLAMQPVFAALLLAMFAGSGRRYAEHFVFSLHSHSLWFLALLLLTATNLEGAILAAVFLHGLLAMRRVYGLGWWGAVWRGLLLSAGYFVLLTAALVALISWIAMTS